MIKINIVFSYEIQKWCQKNRIVLQGGDLRKKHQQAVREIVKNKIKNGLIIQIHNRITIIINDFI